MPSNNLPLRPADIKQVLAYQPDSIVSKVLFNDKNLNITLFSVAKGQEFTPHTTSKQAIVHILDGQGKFMLKNKWHKFEAGDYFFMPKGLLHAIKATHDFKFLLYLFP